jgi:hypothetical protein
LCLTETWQKPGDSYVIEGFSCISVYAKKPKGNRGRCSGGVCVYCKNDIFDGVSVICKDNDGVIWVKLDKAYFNTSDDIFVCVVYILPENSDVSKRNDLDFFDILEDGIAKYQGHGKLFVCGDLNSRVGSADDTVRNNNIGDFIDVCDDGEFVETDYSDIPDRVSEDTVSNNYGRRLINLCKTTGLLIGNGRLGSDKGRGRFTCCTQRGKSVVDYVLLDRSSFDQVSSFEVLDFSEYSVHAPLTICLHANANVSTTQSQANRGTPTEYLLWEQDSEKIASFRGEIASGVQMLDQLIDDLGTHVELGALDHVIDEFASTLYRTSFDLFGHKRNRRTNGVKHKPTDPWFNGNCVDARRNFSQARNLFKRNPTEENRNLFTTERSTYNKAKRKAKYRHKVHNGNKLCGIVKTNPKQFWKTIKQIKGSRGCSNGKLTVDEFFKHFSSLFASTEQVEMTDNEGVVEDDDLDSVITVDEVISAISRLKRDKSAGMDGLIGELFIETADIVTPSLVKLFNCVFNSGVFPTAWTRGVIIPIPKKNNASDVNSFRGITLVSIFGKLYSMILNHRLTLWAQEHEKITQFQFGFQPRKSTIDCIFVLHSIIAKVLSKGDTLFCAFVEFEKAFDKISRGILW